MLFSNRFAIATNTVTAIVCSAILIVLLSQLRRDTKSHSFARLMLILSVLGVIDILTRFMAVSGGNVDLDFMILTILTSSFPYALYTFTIDYFELWTTGRR